MKNIEVELRAFISQEQYVDLLEMFKETNPTLTKDSQTTYYFGGAEDLRIQKNNDYSKIWLKKGKLHDEAREEIEIRFAKEDFDQIRNLFEALGYEIEIVWLRERNMFESDGITFNLDYTEGYGYILELEIISDENEVDRKLSILKEKMMELSIEITPKKDFDKAFQDYKANWRSLISFKN